MTRLPTQAAVVVSAGGMKKKKFLYFPPRVPSPGPVQCELAGWRWGGGADRGGGEHMGEHQGRKETKAPRETAPLMS